MVTSLATVAVLALAASVRSAFATGDGPVCQRPVIQTVSFSSGSAASSKLKWLPYRPVKVTVDPQVTPAAASVPAGAGQEVKAAVGESNGPALLPSSDPFKSPFGQQVVQRDSASEKAPDQLQPFGSRSAEPPVSDKILQRPAPLPMPGEAMPKLPGSDALAPKSSIESGEIPSVPSWQAELASKPPEDRCPTYEELNLKPIKEITSDIAPKGDKFPLECPLRDEKFEPRSWAMTTFTWKASGLCHKPLYFEEPQAERYGHSMGLMQPFASAAHFFLVVPALPYFMGVYPPNECIYTLGYYRPGSCAPYIIDPFPISVRGALLEATAWTGAVFIIP